MAEAQLLIAKYRYEAQEAKELTIEKNDLLTLIDATGKWWKVRNEGDVEGFVPSNFVRQVTWKDAIGRRLGMLKESWCRRSASSSAEPSSPVRSSQQRSDQCVTTREPNTATTTAAAVVMCTADACFDYVPCRGDELLLRKGDRIDVLEKSTDGWWRGVCNHKCGWFPSNYVTENPWSPRPSSVNGGQRRRNDHNRSSVHSASPNSVAVEGASTRRRTVVADKASSPSPFNSPSLNLHNTLQSTRLRAVANGSAKQLYSSKQWYFGKLSRERSQRLLDDYGTDGDFLIRDSESNPGDLSISLKAPSKNKHFWIQVDNDGFRIGNRRFSSIDHLIDHYTNKPISSNGRGENLYLIKPLISL